MFILKVVSGSGSGSMQAVLGLIVMNGAAWHGAAAVVHKVKERNEERSLDRLVHIESPHEDLILGFFGEPRGGEA